MKRRILIACAVLAMVFASAQYYNIPFRPRSAAAGPCTITFLETQISDIATHWNGSSSDTSEVVTITLASGNGAVVAVAWQSTSSAECDGADGSVTDSGSNTYTLVKQQWDSGNEECYTAFYSGLTAGATSVTASFPSGAWQAMSVTEYSGLKTGAYGSVSDVSAVSGQSAAAAWATPTVSPGSTESLVVGLDLDVSGGTTNTPSGGATERRDSNPLFVEDKGTASAGTCANGGAATVAGTVAGASAHISIGLAILRAP